MGDVGAVEALALHDHRLLPDHLLGRDDPGRDAEDRLVDGVAEPVIVNRGETVARAEDDVHEMVAAVRFAKPVRERDLAATAAAFKDSECAMTIRFTDKDVKILGVADDAGVPFEGVSAPNQIRNPGPIQLGERTTIESSRFFVENLVNI